MILSFLGLAAVCVAAYFTYKTANDNGRNGVLWALATLGAGLGFQLILPIIIGIILGIVYISMGTPVERLQEEITGIATIIGFVFFFLSFVAIWLILRHVAKLPDEEPAANVPPPPTFGDGQQQ